MYSREFLYIRQLYKDGELGKLQFFRSSHQQEMAGWPAYWEGFPPMWNATHAIAPTLALGGNEAESVSCYGSGTIDERMHAQLRLAVCHRDRAHQVPQLGPRGGGDPVPVQHRPPVPGKLRRVRLEEELRVDADRGGEPHHPHRGEARSAWRSRILPISFPRRSRGSRRRGSTTARTRSTSPSRRAGATAAPTRTSSTSSSRRCARGGSRSQRAAGGEHHLQRDPGARVGDEGRGGHPAARVDVVLREMRSWSHRL